MMEIVENKLFTNEEVKKNLVGFVHGNGSALIGDKLGLTTKMKNEKFIFMDL